MTAVSLRARLLSLIITPLVLIACGLGYWRYTAALETAEALFDRSLFSAGLAISRDVALSGGDALSVTTRDGVREAAGGEIYYHVAGPDLSYVTGYAYPPRPPRDLADAAGAPAYYRARHRGELVRAVRIRYRNPASPLPGASTVTVWQRGAERTTFARALAIQAAASLAILVGAVAAIVWFGVDRGLKPLDDLQDAISTRSSTDLSGIARPAPREVQGVVATLNSLFAQLRDAFAAREAFISDAAHQLRNPAAAILTLAEAAERAPDDADQARRLADLRIAAERMARLTTQLLSIERLNQAAETTPLAPLDLTEVARRGAEDAAARVLASGCAIAFEGAAPCPVAGDEVLIGEALSNLIDNALVHGPPGLSRIEVSVAARGGRCDLVVADDGTGLGPQDAQAAFARFRQLGASEGSGLGLAIVGGIAKLHGAEASIDEAPVGARLRMSFPRRSDRAGAV